MTAKAKRPREPLTLDARTKGLLGRFWRDWLWPYRAQLGLALLLMALVAGTTGAYPLIIKHSYDALTTPGQAGPVVGDIIVLVLVAIVAVTSFRATVLYLQTVVTSRVIMRAIVDIQRACFAHLLASDFARLSRDPPGQTMSRLTNDLTYLQNATQATLNSAVRDVLTVVALVAAMIYLDWVMALVVLAIYPVAAVPITNIGKRLRRVSKDTQVELGDMTAQLTDALSGARLIKTYGLEAHAANRVSGSFEEVFRLRMKAVRTRARLEPMLEALGGAAIAGVIGLAYFRISSGINTVGDFTGFVSALLMAAQPVRGLGNLNARIQEGLAAAERLYEILDEKPAVIDPPSAPALVISRGAIAFDHVSFAYRDGETVLDDISVTIPAGQTIALVGRSGAGKSTVLNLVPRLFDPTHGRIMIDGQDIRAVSLKSLRGAIAVVSQDITLFNDSVRQNIAFGRLGASDDQIRAAAQAAAADDFIMALPKGYDTVIGADGFNLSGGQRQRVALARAILKDAPILLLDEATSALDTQSEQLVQEALAAFSRDRTTMVIAHRLATVQNAHRIVVMDQGRIIEEGTHASLLARGGAYAELCQAQFLQSADLAK